MSGVLLLHGQPEAHVIAVAGIGAAIAIAQETASMKPSS
jgi:hypothetical protein